MEHRWGQRDEVAIPVRLRWQHRYGAAIGEITNISTSGAWVQTAAQMPLLAPIEVDMRSVEGRSRIEAYVVRRTSSGIGIEWRVPLHQGFQLTPYLPERLRIHTIHV